MENEDIKWANAAEIGHMINAVNLSMEQKKVISEFLVKKNETNYNYKLEKFKVFLSTIPNSKLFSDALRPIGNDIDDASKTWNRYDPIDQTPSSHLLHGSYVRIPPKYMAIYGDKDIGKPMPDIFYRKQNIMGTEEQYDIGKFTKIYEIIQPFGYHFPDLITDDTMQFRLIDITNPHYVNLSRRDSKYKGAPTPIYKDGHIIPIMTGKQYMEVYKKFLENKAKSKPLKA